MAKIINGSTIYLALADYLATNAYINDTAKDVLVMVAKWIDEAPTVDAVEVVHRQWVPLYLVDWLFDKKRLTDYVCSGCGQLHKKKSNYCPNCGAKMDGGKDDG